MFLFIANEYDSMLYTAAFKYISCSYLSHVGSFFYIVSVIFKYISCSYLSGKKVANTIYYLWFKYISCSYLSRCFFISSKPAIHIQIHLMFLFIQEQRLSRQPANNSNTSHVLIYRTSTRKSVSVNKFKYISCSYLSSTNLYGIKTPFRIQIHLMFLFICFLLKKLLS